MSEILDCPKTLVYREGENLEILDFSNEFNHFK